MMRKIEYSKILEAQKNLLPPKGSSQRGGDIQRTFLKSARDSDWDFCKEIRKWGLQEGEEPQVPSQKWSEREFVDPPSSTEEIVHDTWGELTPAEASRPETWFSINLAMIERKIIESSYLASDSGRTTTGRDFITDALEGNNDPDKIDRCVRRILRRLGGVLERGSRTVYLDCPPARAWWRRRYASEAHEIFERNIGDLSNLLRKKPIWNELIPAMTSSLTLIGDSSIRPSLISFLERKDSDDFINKGTVKKLILRIGRRAEIQALGSLSPEQVLEVISNDIFPLLQKENSA